MWNRKRNQNRKEKCTRLSRPFVRCCTTDLATRVAAVEITCVIGRRRIRSSVTAIRSRRRWNTAGASPRWSRNRQNRVTVGPVWSTARFTLATASVRSSFPPTTEAATDPEFRIGLGSLTELSPNLSFQILPLPCCLCLYPFHPTASLTLARQTVYATVRNLACQWGKNSWQCARGCVAMRVMWSSACHVVAKFLKYLKNRLPRCHDLSRRNC